MINLSPYVILLRRMTPGDVALNLYCATELRQCSSLKFTLRSNSATENGSHASSLKPVIPVSVPG